VEHLSQKQENVELKISKVHSSKRCRRIMANRAQPSLSTSLCISKDKSLTGREQRILEYNQQCLFQALWSQRGKFPHVSHIYRLLQCILRACKAIKANRHVTSCPYSYPAPAPAYHLIVCPAFRQSVPRLLACEVSSSSAAAMALSSNSESFEKFI
jgi:hypothetical protein